MGLFEDLSKALAPHSTRLNDTIHLQGALLHTKLGVIERHLADLGKPDVGDLWMDLGVNGKLAAKTPKELIGIRMNEIFTVQSASVLGEAAIKQIIVRANGRLRLVMPVGATTPGVITPGGNVVFLPGEVITVEFEGEGTAEFSMTCTRRILPVEPHLANTGVSGERLGPTNTHDPARDEVRSKTETYSEVPGETRDVGGRPSLVH